MMTKLSEEQKINIIINSFFDELEKLSSDNYSGELEKIAGPFSLAAKLLRPLVKLKNYAKAGVSAVDKGGWKNLTNYLASHGTNQFKKIDGTLNMIKPTARWKETGALQKAIGNSINNIKSVSSGLKGKSLGGKIKQVGINTKDLVKRQLTSARYRTVDPKFVQNGVYSKPFLGRNFLPRKVEGMAGKDYIVKKRLPAQALSMATTPVGFGATAFAFNPNKKKGAAEGVKEFAEWSFASPYAGAKLMKDLFSSSI